VETVMPDGRRILRRPGECGFTTVFPDGTRSRGICNEVQPATPPLPTAASAAWLNEHSTRLLDIIRALLGSDQASIANYLRANEPASHTIFDTIRTRASAIALLTSS
jgi:hypothetical protein